MLNVDNKIHSKPSDCETFHRLHKDLKIKDGFRIIEGQKIE